MRGVRDSRAAFADDSLGTASLDVPAVSAVVSLTSADAARRLTRALSETNGVVCGDALLLTRAAMRVSVRALAARVALEEVAAVPLVDVMDDVAAADGGCVSTMIGRIRPVLVGKKLGGSG